MADEANQGTSGTSQADVKKAVEEALKGLPGFLALLETVQNLAQPAVDVLFLRRLLAVKVDLKMCFSGFQDKDNRFVRSLYIDYV